MQLNVSPTAVLPGHQYFAEPTEVDSNATEASSTFVCLLCFQTLIFINTTLGALIGHEIEERGKSSLFLRENTWLQDRRNPLTIIVTIFIDSRCITRWYFYQATCRV